jgi:hypothetical protein
MLDIETNKAKKMKKTTKKKVAKKKAVKETFVSHFHCGNRLALTICSKTVPGSDIYCLGMALVHKNDVGSRKKGLETAFNRCINGIEEFEANQKLIAEDPFPNVPEKRGLWAAIKRLFRNEPPALENTKNLVTELMDKGVYGKSGHWLVVGADLPKILIKDLRKTEKLQFDDPKLVEDTYCIAFFKLDGL